LLEFRSMTIENRSLKPSPGFDALIKNIYLLAVDYHINFNLVQPTNNVWMPMLQLPDSSQARTSIPSALASRRRISARIPTLLLLAVAVLSALWWGLAILPTEARLLLRRSSVLD
jgi:hypothetical protein